MGIRILYLLCFSSGVLWALGAGIGRVLLRDENRPAGDDEPLSPLPLHGRSVVAALLTGFGGAGALLEQEGRLTGPFRVALALAVGSILAALVYIVVNGFLIRGTDES